MKLEIINTPAGICRGFLDFEEEINPESNVPGKIGILGMGGSSRR
jgi:hypothetical protein